MTDLVEYNIYLTGWDTKLVSLCTRSIENSLYEHCGEVAMIEKLLVQSEPMGCNKKKCPMYSVGHCRD